MARGIAEGQERRGVGQGPWWLPVVPRGEWALPSPTGGHQGPYPASTPLPPLREVASLLPKNLPLRDGWYGGGSWTCGIPGPIIPSATVLLTLRQARTNCVPRKRLWGSCCRPCCVPSTLRWPMAVSGQVEGSRERSVAMALAPTSRV